MFNPRSWCYRHMRHLRLALVLCLVVSYGTLLLVSIPVLAYFEQIRAVENPSLKSDEVTSNSAGLAGLLGLNPAVKQEESPSKSLILKDRLELERSLREIFKSMNVSLPETTSNESLRHDSTLQETLIPGTFNLSVFPPLLTAWMHNKMTTCNDQLVLYAKEFARLTSVLIDRKFCISRAKGGEEIKDVIGQDEFAEFYNAIRHCFQLDCGRSDIGVARYRFNGNNFLTQWLSNLKTFDLKMDEQTVTEPGFTIALMRREYANLYHTVNDWYNLFLMMVFFRKQPAQTDILLVDTHPKGSLDPAWPVLFNSSRMLSALPQRTVFSEMVWGMQGYNSVLKESYRFQTRPPLMEEFRRFVIDRFQLQTTKQLNCTRLSVLFVWRRDYLAHPRNPTGLVQRKIANEDELLLELQRRHPNYVIKGVQIDQFSIRDQLKLVSETDILVGMHGAGLSHTLFVPPHGAMIELVPSYYGSDNHHFINLVKWRGLAGLRWINRDIRNELKNFKTTIPPDVMDTLLTKVADQMCSESQDVRLSRRNSAFNTEQFDYPTTKARPILKFNRNFKVNPVVVQRNRRQ